MIDRLNTSIRAAQQVMEYARTDQGKVRNAKLLLAASDHQRRCLETAVRLHDAVREQAGLDRFRQTLIAEITAESPDCAARIIRRLQVVAASMLGENNLISEEPGSPEIG